MKNAEVLSELQKQGIDYNTSITAVEAKVLLSEWQKKNVELKIIKIAKEQGHSVMFTPPYYSDLQPIELIWARVKASIAKE